MIIILKNADFSSNNIGHIAFAQSLSTPSISLNDSIITGSAVPNAQSYKLYKYAGGTYIELATQNTGGEISFNLSAISGLSAAGTYALVVQAYATGYGSSAYSTAVEYVVSGGADIVTTVWYVNPTEVMGASSFDQRGSNSGAGWAYTNAATNAAYQNKPINAIRCVGAMAGMMNIYKTNSNPTILPDKQKITSLELIKVASINIENTTELVVYKFNGFQLNDNEFLVFADSTGTGCPCYSNSVNEAYLFCGQLKEEGTLAKFTQYTLGVDIGYVV